MKKANGKVIICKKCNKPFYGFKITDNDKITILKVCPYCLNNNRS